MSPLLEIKDLKVHFTIRRGFIEEMFSRKISRVKAVDGIDLTIEKGEILSLVGESGSGKTTTGKALVSLVERTAGSVLFEGKELPRGTGNRVREFRKKAQIIFQDPYQSLNPRDSIYDIVEEPLLVNGLVDNPAVRKEKVLEALCWAGLTPPEDYLYRLPHELSGGQRQRVAIAAALIMQPSFLVADEPVSMLDVSIRADILKLLVGLRDTLGISCLFITHDLSLAWLISDRIAIMYLGKIMEVGSPDLIVGSCLHPYTKALVEVMPLAKIQKSRERTILRGETPNPLDMPSGCRFHPRCPCSMDICLLEEPPLIPLAPGHLAACHRLTSCQ
ncbi:MAG: ABC transporter ATP-binding protein [Spirochaetales bacterium]|nr:ABC transporter ATP-binding protein [Spirochaetales bacterium]